MPQVALWGQPLKTSPETVGGLFQEIGGSSPAQRVSMAQPLVQLRYLTPSLQRNGQPKGFSLSHTRSHLPYHRALRSRFRPVARRDVVRRSLASSSLGEGSREAPVVLAVSSGLVVPPLVSEEDTWTEDDNTWLECNSIRQEVYDSDEVVEEESVSKSCNPYLTDVKVQSAEEQEELAKTPAHPAALKGLLALYVSNCFVERTFRFAVPAVIACLHDSLVPVAVMGFAGQLAMFAVGPIIGDIMDSTPRISAINTLTVVQTAAMVSSAAVTILALRSGASLAASAGELVTKPWFIFLTVMSVVERLSGLASGVAFERDWVVQLAGPSRPLALAKANALLRRFDLLCEVIGPCAFGWLLSKTSPAFALRMGIGAVLLFVPIQISLVTLTNHFASGALLRPRTFTPLSPQPLLRSPPLSLSHIKSALATTSHGWKLYLQQPVLPASIAYVLLFFNAVLSPGGLMTSFLTQRGMDPQLIGCFRGACGVLGFMGTYASTELIRNVGVLKAGAVALISQALCLAAAVTVYLLTPAAAGVNAGLLVFLAFITLSRLGMWAYDVVDTQIFQQAVPVADSNVVGTTEMSLASLAELVMLAIAMAADDPSHFGTLAALSMASVAGAAAVYCRWLVQGTPEQKRLEMSCMGFSEDEMDSEVLPAQS